MTVDHPADLTPLQRRYLRNLREYLDRPPTLGRMYAKNVRPTTLLVVLIGGTAAACVAFGELGTALLCTGMLVGALSRDLGIFAASLRLWPATRAVIDERKLDELLGHEPTDR